MVKKTSVTLHNLWMPTNWWLVKLAKPKFKTIVCEKDFSKKNVGPQIDKKKWCACGE